MALPHPGDVEVGRGQVGLGAQEVAHDRRLRCPGLEQHLREPLLQFRARDAQLLGRLRAAILDRAMLQRTGRDGHHRREMLGERFERRAAPDRVAQRAARGQWRHAGGSGSRGRAGAERHTDL